MPLGYRIFTSIDRPDPELVAALGEHFSADLADSMRKAGAVSTDIKPLYAPMPRFAGPAVTASLPTASFSMGKMAMDQCQAGDVLILNAHGDVQHAMFGGHIAHALKVRGLAGVIVDGAVRDVSELQAEQLTVFARGTTVIVGGHDGPGEINVPVALGGVVVKPGDIVVADSDGIVVVPIEFAEDVLKAVRELKERHNASHDQLAQGVIPGNSAILDRIARDGCELIG